MKEKNGNGNGNTVDRVATRMALEAEAKDRMKKCQDEVLKVLEKYDCAMLGEPYIERGLIRAAIRIVPK